MKFKHFSLSFFPFLANDLLKESIRRIIIFVKHPQTSIAFWETAVVCKQDPETNSGVSVDLDFPLLKTA